MLWWQKETEGSKRAAGSTAWGLGCVLLIGCLACSRSPAPPIETTEDATEVSSTGPVELRLEEAVDDPWEPDPKRAEQLAERWLDRPKDELLAAYGRVPDSEVSGWWVYNRPLQGPGALSYVHRARFRVEGGVVAAAVSERRFIGCVLREPRAAADF